MNYNIFDRVAPAMPSPSRGTEICKLLLSQASKDMRETLVPMAIPALAAHLSDVRFMYSDNKYYKLCGQMGHLIGPSGIGKAQLTHLIEAMIASTPHETVVPLTGYPRGTACLRRLLQKTQRDAETLD